MAAVVHPTRSTVSIKPLRPTSPRTRINHNSPVKGASKPTSPRIQTGPNYKNITNSSNGVSTSPVQQHQPYLNQSRSTAGSVGSSISIDTKQKHTSSAKSRPASPSPVTMSSGTAIKHGHSLSISTTSITPNTINPISTVSSPLSASAPGPYPTPSTHPPLRLLTTATCLDTLTTLVSAQSPPHSPTFSSFALPKSSSGSISSRSNSILDGIQSAFSGALSSSSPPYSSNTLKSSSSTYSAAKESLADFSIAPSKRSPTSSNSSNESKGYNKSGGVVRSRSNYVSFPNFDEVDFVDVAMVDDLDEDDDDEQQDWSGPDSPPEGQGPTLMDQNVLNEKMMRTDVQDQCLIGGTGGGRRDPRLGLGMSMSPSQHWLLQLETYQERV
ncbi:hypothetical protein BGZ51_002279 [Haplosporangium sp. Z 767]|nr:hypothetical protein BGZ51_002279 [Haplosporangium sp. Z 767]KAF9190717.1 hypothetical protein BGZ50_009858 [Haplosporangium sp. Z 11]